MTITLRPYQNEAIQAIYSHFEEHTTNPLVVLPTGTGKSLVIAEFLRGAITAWPETKAVALAHVQELIEQNFAELTNIWPFAPAGIYSAGLKQRDLSRSITVASIQSIWKRAFDLQKVDLVIVDEAHLISRKADSMYGKFLADLKVINPAVKVVGLTATAYRMDSGRLDTGDNRMFDRICYEANIRDMIAQGYLCKIKSRNAATQIDTTGVHTRGGEFIPGELERAADQDATNRAIIDEIMRLGEGRKSWLIFCTGLSHAKHLAEILRERGIAATDAPGDMPKDARAQLVADFRAGKIQAICNVAIFTTGFNAPNVDLVALARPTKSPGLYIQMVGRGTRNSFGKADCLVLDFGGNILRHGPIDTPHLDEKTGKAAEGAPPVKECPKCGAMIHAAHTVCPECGAELPRAPTPLQPKASEAPILSSWEDAMKDLAPKWVELCMIDYDVHRKKDKATKTPIGSPMLKVIYYETYETRHYDYVCLEHSGFARRKAEQWWVNHGGAMPIPMTIPQAMGRLKELTVPTHIKIQKDPPATPGGKAWIRVIDWKAEEGHEVENLAPTLVANTTNDELPF